MTATHEPPCVRPALETIAWQIDLCAPWESPAGLSAALTGLHLRGGLALVEQGRVVRADADWLALGAALCGLHPLDRIRALFRETGSLEWRQFAATHQISTRVLEDLASRWPHYGAVTEAALLEAACDPRQREDLKPWRLLGEKGQAALEKLADSFRLGPELHAPELTRRIAAAAPGALDRRLLLAAPGQPVTLEVILPLLDRREWFLRDEILPGLRVESDSSGRLWVLRPDDDLTTARNRFNCLAAGAGPWLPAPPHPRPAGFSLSFEDTREFAPECVKEEYLELLDGYGLAGPARAALNRFATGSPVRADLCLSLPGESVLRWMHLPAERDETYAEAIAPVAAALQAVSRRWSPMVWFENLEETKEVFLTQFRLAFAATPPNRSLSRGGFGYEILDETSRRRAMEGARQNLPHWLLRTKQRLLAAGQPARAKSYTSRALNQIMRMLSRCRRTYDGYLLADAQNINQFELLAKAGRSLRQAVLQDPARAVRRLTDFMADFLIALGKRTRRMFPGGELAGYPSLLLLEATHAIAPDIPLQVVLVLSQDGRSVVVRRP